jgi:hypothetical protein
LTVTYLLIVALLNPRPQLTESGAVPAKALS